MRRRWLLIVSCVLLAVAAAEGVTFAMTPMYESSARLFVTTSPSDTSDAYQGSLFSAQRVTSYADLVNGEELATRVVDTLELDTDPADLGEQVSATVVPETVILELTVEDPDPRQAQVLAGTYAAQLIALVGELETPPGKKVAPIKATVVDAASFSDTPVSPQPLRNLGLAGILGLLLGLGLAVLRELLDTTVKTRQDIEETTGAPLMADIAYDAGAARTPLITSLDSHAPRLEAFRVLRTNMQFVDVDRDSKIFVVSSSVPGEGKTTTAVNLAITLAQAGQKVLILDGDLRRPQVATLLQREPTVGLTSVLIGTIGFQEAVQETTEPNLWAMTSGRIPPNPSELLQSHAMAETLELARKYFDVIVIDSPPLLPVTDAALLAHKADGALVVVRHSKTTRDQLGHSMERLAAVDATLLGVVFNMVPVRKRGSRYGGYGYGGYGYGYGYGYAPEKKRSIAVGSRKGDGDEAQERALSVGRWEDEDRPAS